MSAAAGIGRRAPSLVPAAACASAALFAIAAATAMPIAAAAGLLTLVLGVAVWHRALLAWPTLVGATLLVIMFIPIKRYRIPGSLPFELEPYRVAVTLVAAAWLTSLLIDRRVRLHKTGWEGPLALFAFAAVTSVIVNDSRINNLGVSDKVVKELTFFVSFLIVLFLIVSVARARSAIEVIIKLLVSSGAIIAFFAIIESRTGFNPFNRLSAIPLLEPAEFLSEQRRAGKYRAYGPAQHPIALGAALVMLLPLAVYLAHGLGRRRWWFAAALIGLGALGTITRTSVLMMAVVAAVFLWLRPHEMKRLWPLLLPALVVVHFALPGTIGAFRQSFFPEGGLIADQSQNPGSRGQGRVADVAPTLSEVSESPIVGHGYGSRVVDGETPNAQILDNEWLATLLETGFVGAFAFLWLFVRAIRRLGRAARGDPSPRGWLTAALAASIAALAVGMLTFDAFSFIQVTFLLFIMLALASAALADRRDVLRAAS